MLDLRIRTDDANFLEVIKLANLCRFVGGRSDRVVHFPPYHCEGAWSYDFPPTIDVYAMLLLLH